MARTYKGCVDGNIKGGREETDRARERMCRNAKQAEAEQARKAKDEAVCAWGE